MKFTLQIAAAVLATGAAAHAPSRVVRSQPDVVARQIAVVTGVLNQVSGGISDLDSAVNAFSGDGSDLDSAAQDLIAIIKKGQTTVEGSDDLTLADALGLQAPVKALTAKGQTLTDDLEAKKSAVEDAGLCEDVASQIGNINAASQALIKTTVSKVPEDAQAIAASLAAGLTKVLNEVQDAYSPANCVDKTSGGGSSSSAAPPASSTGAGSYPTTTAAATTPAPTGTGYPTPPPPAGNSTTAAPAPPISTGGASIMAPAGALVMAVAAALL